MPASVAVEIQVWGGLEMESGARDSEAVSGAAHRLNMMRTELPTELGSTECVSQSEEFGSWWWEPD